MIDLDKLSDEEISAMAEEEGIDLTSPATAPEPDSSGTSIDLDALSDEEVLDMLKEEGIETDLTPFSAGVSGLVQGVTLGFGDEISATIESVVTGNDREQLLAEKRREIELLKSAQPGAFFGGEVVGGIGLSVASAGAGAPIAGLRGAAIIGGLAGVGTSTKKGTELLKDAAIGAALGAGGEKVAKGIGVATRKLFSNSSDSLKKVFSHLGETTHPNNVALEKNIIKAAFLGKHGSADELLGTRKALEASQLWAENAPTMIRDLLNQEKRQLGAELQDVIADNANVKLNMRGIVDDLTESLKAFGNIGAEGEAVKQVKAKILDPINNGTLKIGDEVLDFSNLDFSAGQKMKQLISGITFKNVDPTKLTDEGKIFANAKGVSAALEAFSGRISKEIGAADVTGRLPEINSKFSKIFDAEKLAPKNITELLALSSTHGKSDHIRKGNTFMATLLGHSPELQEKIIGEIRSPSALFEMNEMAAKVPGLFTLRAASNFGGIPAVLAGIPAVGIRAAQIAGRAQRAAFKVPRSVSGIVQNKDIIISKLSDFHPGLAVALNDAIQTGNAQAVENIAVGILQTPGMKEEFEDGFGFEGKAVTPEESAEVEQGIMSSNLTLRQKFQQRQEFRATSMLPQEEEPAQTVQGSFERARRDSSGRKVTQY